MLYAIPYKGLKNGSYNFDFQVDSTLFETYNCEEIKGGNCEVCVKLNRAETMLELNVSINGEVICECDRCLEDCPITIDYNRDLVVKFSDEIDEYDGDVMWISPAEDSLDLTQYIYESIILSLPYRRVHEEGGCNPDMLAAFATISEEEFERMAAEADEDEEVAMDDHNRELLEELKRKMEQRE